MKKSKGPVKQFHTSRSQMGMGDFKGVGIKQKIGKGKSYLDGDIMTNKKIGKPPKSMA